MQKRHSDGRSYFNELVYTSEKYLLPFIEEIKKIDSEVKVLEIGCGMGGNLLPFVQRGCAVTGVDLGKNRIENAAEMLDSCNNPSIELICGDIFAVNLQKCFDLIIVHDVIEHIPDKDRFFESLRGFLNPGGIVFLAFPSWQMPFGGHQQICKNRLLSHLPFYHLLPRFMYRGLLKLFGEEESTINELLSIKKCGITIEGCKKYTNRFHYKIHKQFFYFINPHYEIKFKLKPRKLSEIITAIPYLRNYFCTSSFWLISDDL